MPIDVPSAMVLTCAAVVSLGGKRRGEQRGLKIALRECQRRPHLGQRPAHAAGRPRGDAIYHSSRTEPLALLTCIHQGFKARTRAISQPGCGGARWASPSKGAGKRRQRGAKRKKPHDGRL
ncbi:hypothetical protein MRX96_016548 [Rhipicephalus microplus]